MAIDKIFNDGNVDGIADNIFNAVNNSVSEVKQMQQRKAAENAQMVVQSLKKIDTDIRSKFDNVTDVLEKRIITIKDGRDGINGKDGRDGKDGKAGRDGKDGKQGIQGLKGQDGIDGLDGVSVANANIDFDGSLIIALSNGQEINVGEVVSPDLADKIQVISTMSTNGAVGIKDEGSSISTGVKNINFVGATVTATNSGDDVTVNVSAGTGTVTSVAATVPTFLSVTGSPITTSGTLAISLSGTALPVANGGTGITSFGTGVATALGVNVGTAGAPVVNGGALGTPSSGTVTNLTGTASININGTVGATTASTGAFTTLTATLDSTFSSTGALTISKGNTAARPSPASGMLRFNTQTVEFEGYNGTAWAAVGGGATISNDTSTATDVFPLFANATSGTASSVFTGNANLLYKPSTGELKARVPVASNGIVVNSQTVATSYTIAAGFSGMSAGPITLSGGVVVTLSSGSRWVVQ